MLDEATRANLELFDHAHGRQDGGLAARRARRDAHRDGRAPACGAGWRRRCVDVAQIRRRHDAVERLVAHAALRAELRARARARSPISSGSPAAPRSAWRRRAIWWRWRAAWASCRALRALVHGSLAGDAAARLAHPELLELPAGDEALCGDVGRRGRRARWPTIRRAQWQGRRLHPRAASRRELDELRRHRRGRAATGSRDRGARARAHRHRARSRSRYNRVFGYYIEITRTQPRRGARATTCASRRWPTPSASSPPELAELRGQDPRAPTSGASRSSWRSFERAARRGRRRRRERLLALAGRGGAARRAGRARRGGPPQRLLPARGRRLAASSSSRTAAIPVVERLAAARQLRPQRRPRSTPTPSSSCSSPAPTWPASRR